MSGCPINPESKHTFTSIPCKKQYDDDIYQYITCVDCGHRRAITNDGILIKYDATNSQWVVA